MTLPEEGLLLRIFIGESDMHEGVPLYERIVRRARELHIAGATVLRGVMGYGASSRLHTAKLLEISEDMPMVVELVDTEEKLNLLLPFLRENVRGGMMTLEKVKVLHYLHGEKRG
jgi:hypothetical protein